MSRADAAVDGAHSPLVSESGTTRGREAVSLAGVWSVVPLQTAGVVDVDTVLEIGALESVTALEVAALEVVTGLEIVVLESVDVTEFVVTASEFAAGTGLVTALGLVTEFVSGTLPDFTFTLAFSLLSVLDFTLESEPEFSSTPEIDFAPVPVSFAASSPGTDAADESVLLASAFSSLLVPSMIGRGSRSAGGGSIMLSIARCDRAAAPPRPDGRRR